jgi:hypothetical protein
MNIETARSFFLWCSVINYALLGIWAVIATFGRDRIKPITTGCRSALLRRTGRFRVILCPELTEPHRCWPPGPFRSRQDRGNGDWLAESSERACPQSCSAPGMLWGQFDF